MKVFVILLVVFSFFYVPHYVQASDCAAIQSVASSASTVQPDSPFTCSVTVDSAHAGSSTIACGISFDGKYPENYCPSDTKFGGWKGALATFNCSINQAALSANAKSLELVAFDFRPECGVAKAKRALLTASAPQAPENTSSSDQQFPNTNGGVGQGIVPNPPSKPQLVTPLTEVLEKKDVNYPSNLISLAQDCLDNKAVYEQASQATGIPWQVLAGIHYREGNCDKNKSLVSGRTIGTNEPDLRGNCSSKNSGSGKPFPIAVGCAFHTLLDTAIYSGNHLKGKIGIVPESLEQVTLALSRYNGGGNSNCGKTPYSSCPSLYPGEDDTYVMNLLDDRHKTMFIVYCADFTLCHPPKIDPRPGTLTISSLMSSL